MGIGNIATTGMQAAMTNMEVISNNISNSGTYGFKSSSANFADLFPSGNAASSVQAGLGVSVTGIEQNFQPGGPTPTSNPSDLAIKGNGFFVMTDASSGVTSYSRYGRFNFQNGYLTVGNARLQGFLSTDGKTIPSGGGLQDLFINTATTPANKTATVTQVQLNLNSSDSVPSVSPFNPTNLSSYNFTSTAPVYDSLGNQNTLTLYYVKTSANNWNVNAYITPPGGTATSLGTGSLTFTGTGALSSTSGLGALTFSPTTGATSPQTFAVDMTGATQYGAPDFTGQFTTDGYPVGAYTGYTIDQNGIVTVQHSNKVSTVAGQVAIANFQTPTGLQNIGNMSWTATTASGTPNVNQSNSSNNLLQSNLELSNVDLASEMVNLVNAQNTFQANAQVEQTYSQVMQTVTKL